MMTGMNINRTTRRVGMKDVTSPRLLVEPLTSITSDLLVDLSEGKNRFSHIKGRVPIIHSRGKPLSLGPAVRHAPHNRSVYEEGLILGM